MKSQPYPLVAKAGQVQTDVQVGSPPEYGGTKNDETTQVFPRGVMQWYLGAQRELVLGGVASTRVVKVHQIQIPRFRAVQYQGTTVLGFNKGNFSWVLGASPSLQFLKMYQPNRIHIQKWPVWGLQTACLQHRRWMYSVDVVRHGDRQGERRGLQGVGRRWEGLAAEAVSGGSPPAMGSAHGAPCAAVSPSLVWFLGRWLMEGHVLPQQTCCLTWWFHAPIHGAQGGDTAARSYLGSLGKGLYSFFKILKTSDVPG